MCGIAGVVTRSGTRAEAGRVLRMLEALARRGPDGVAHAVWEQAVLGHRRLAILDLSERGRQPMLSADGRTGVVFNGAIYNFIELRRELRACGFEFRSGTDTEVLLHGYAAWGIDELVARLHGMYAFGVWDEQSRELYLVRDRLGVKPLAWAESGNTLAFASTPGALRAAGFGGELDEQAVADFLEWGVVPDQRSIHEGVHKLPPATIVRWRDGALESRTYWTPPNASSSGAGTFDEAVERTEELFLSAVRMRTRADVPIGVLLSGGVDSALVCWALREAGADVAAYTFSAPGAPEDESADAVQTARELGIPLHVLESEGEADEWDELGAAYTEPFACGSAIGMLRLSRAVREAATVLLTGDGGDDVFLGYPQHRYLLRAQGIAAHLPRGLASIGTRAAAREPASGAVHRARNYASYITSGLGAFLRVRPSFRWFRNQGMLGPRLSGVLPESHRVPLTAGSGAAVLSDYLAYVQTHQFVAEYMTKVDGATMYHGLEARSPFLDQVLWDHAAALPYSVRLNGGEPKAVLRAIARRRISARVAAGRKRGFEVPVTAWLSGRWKERAIAALESSGLEQDGWLDCSRAAAVLRTGGPIPLHLWHAVVLAAWTLRWPIGSASYSSSSLPESDAVFTAAGGT